MVLKEQKKKQNYNSRCTATPTRKVDAREVRLQQGIDLGVRVCELGAVDLWQTEQQEY